MGRNDQSNEEGAAKIMIDIEEGAATIKEGATEDQNKVEERTAMR